MNKKILVTGSNGQLGQELQSLAPSCSADFIFTDRNTLDITDYTAVAKLVKANRIDVIINCAAYTAVDKAETDQGTAQNINHHAVQNLVDISNTHNITLCHVSTDFVYNGHKSTPYIESDETSPLSVYGETKLLGEEAIINVCNDYLIIRTSWVYSSYGSNFVKTMQLLGRERDELGIIFDQIGTPTYARDLAQTILDMLLNEKNDPKNRNTIYHYSNEGVASWYDFAKAIMTLSDIECKIKPIEAREYPTPARRPAYSVMNKSKIKTAYNIEIPYWRDSLEICIKAMKEEK